MGYSCLSFDTLVFLKELLKLIFYCQIAENSRLLCQSSQQFAQMCIVCHLVMLFTQTYLADPTNSGVEKTCKRLTKFGKHIHTKHYQYCDVFEKMCENKHKLLFHNEKDYFIEEVGNFTSFVVN